ncbi:hypothetical protein FLAV_02557 [Flavobacteriales bacterium]|nr:hypothetical protein FLAV_02557 [Flavobacteriales bacterium]
MQNSEVINTNDIKEIYLIPVDFFNPKNFIERYKKELAIFRRRIREEDKEKVKGALNTFYIACINSQLDEKIKLEIHLGFFDTLNFYAQQYSSKQTYQNIISAFEKPELKSKLFSKHTAKSSIIYAETLLMYHNLLKSEEPFFSFDKTELLIKAKSYLWKVYIQYLENKNPLNQADLSHCLTLLSLGLTELSRWFEPLYYLNVAKENLQHNPNIEYTRALLLEAVKEKTCLSFNGLLLLKIIDSCMEAKKLPQILTEQKKQLIKTESECRKNIKDYNLDIKNLRKHKAKVSKSIIRYNAYKKFCVDSQLFINEHSFYCKCNKATSDDLQIETNHEHTKIDWVKQFHTILDVSIYDFIVARHNYYYSLAETKISTFQINGVKRINSNDGIKNALLKNSFKTLYSILDQIAHGIFQVLNIDYQSKLKIKFPDEKERPKIYFLNMWDKELALFDKKHFEDNFYLISLYSISRDLSKSDYAALSNFRKLRNAMEHNVLHIVKSDKEVSHYKSLGEEVCTKEELIEKTKILMLLTKSAIFSFTYLIRRQSKVISINKQ